MLCRNVQDILDANFVFVFRAERNIANVLNGMCVVVSYLHLARPIGCTQVVEPLLVGCHVI